MGLSAVEDKAAEGVSSQKLRPTQEAGVAAVDLTVCLLQAVAMGEEDKSLEGIFGELKN